MQIHTKNQMGLSRRLRRASGMTLIEISLVIALLLGLIAVVFMGLGTYRKGADKAKCRIQLAQTQKAIRSYANFQNLQGAAAAAFGKAQAFGAGLAMETEPVCPSGTAYAWATGLPAIGSPFGTCPFIDADTVTNHVLATADTQDW